MHNNSVTKFLTALLDVETIVFVVLGLAQRRSKYFTWCFAYCWFRNVCKWAAKWGLERKSHFCIHCKGMWKGMFLKTCVFLLVYLFFCGFSFCPTNLSKKGWKSIRYKRLGYWKIEISIQSLSKWRPNCSKFLFVLLFFFFIASFFSCY